MNTKLLLSAVILANLGNAHASTQGYAEALYSDYSTASNNQVTFTLYELAQGSMSSLKGAPISLLIGAPSYIVSGSDHAISIENVKLEAVAGRKSPVDAEDLNFEVDEFDRTGYPYKQGEYRLFTVGVQIGKELYSHKAVEFCWEKQSYCQVIDLNVDFLDSVVNGIREQKAKGWSVLHTSTPADTMTEAGRCGIASNPSIKTREENWPAYDRVYKRGGGRVMGRIYVKSVQLGMRCDTSCNGQVYGLVNASSGTAYGITSTVCDMAEDKVNSGRSVRHLGVTGCAHKTNGHAQFDISIEGLGSLATDFDIDIQGAHHQNGGVLRESCAFF